MNQPSTLRMRSLRFPLRSLRLCVEQHLSNPDEPPNTTINIINSNRPLHLPNL